MAFDARRLGSEALREALRADGDTRAGHRSDADVAIKKADVVLALVDPRAIEAEYISRIAASGRPAFRRVPEIEEYLDDVDFGEVALHACDAANKASSPPRTFTQLASRMRTNDRT